MIIEPSVIILKGISELIIAIDARWKITCVDSINNSFKLNPDEAFSLVLINPILFNNTKSKLKKFSVHFKGLNQLGLISTYFDRKLCSNFIDCIYLNDDNVTIVNTITKYLQSEPEETIGSDNILSEREKDVVRILAYGKSHKEIAEELFISIHTVISHRKNISNKLGIKSAAALVIYAVANNIIDLNDYLKSVK